MCSRKSIHLPYSIIKRYYSPIWHATGRSVFISVGVVVPFHKTDNILGGSRWWCCRSHKECRRKSKTHCCLFVSMLEIVWWWLYGRYFCTVCCTFLVRHSWCNEAKIRSDWKIREEVLVVKEDSWCSWWVEKVRKKEKSERWRELDATGSGGN